MFFDEQPRPGERTSSRASFAVIRFKDPSSHVKILAAAIVGAATAQAKTNRAVLLASALRRFLAFPYGKSSSGEACGKFAE